MQAHPVRLVAAVPLAVGFPAHGKAASVRRVARYAMADMRQMHANLMATPGDWTALHKRARRSVEERAKSAQRAATENLELCAARLAAVALHGVRRPGDRHARRVVPVRGDGFVNRRLIPRGVANYHRAVRLADVPVRKRARACASGLLGKAAHHDPRRAVVELVSKTRVRFAKRLRISLRDKARHRRFVIESFLLPLLDVYAHVVRFVDNDDASALVFMHDGGVVVEAHRLSVDVVLERALTQAEVLFRDVFEICDSVPHAIQQGRVFCFACGCIPL